MLFRLRTLRTTPPAASRHTPARSEEHTSELQSPNNLVCRLLLEKKTDRRHPRIAPSPPARPATVDDGRPPHRVGSSGYRAAAGFRRRRPARRDDRFFFSNVRQPPRIPSLPPHGRFPL